MEGIIVTVIKNLRLIKLKRSSSDYRYAYILVKEIIILAGEGLSKPSKVAEKNIEQVLFKNCVPFTDSICKVNNMQANNAKDLDVIIPMYNLLEYSDSYTETSAIL